MFPSFTQDYPTALLVSIVFFQAGHHAEVRKQDAVAPEPIAICKPSLDKWRKFLLFIFHGELKSFEVGTLPFISTLSLVNELPSLLFFSGLKLVNELPSLLFISGLKLVNELPSL